MGETQNALHIRTNGHRDDIAHRRIEKPVEAHFNSTDHLLRDLMILVIEAMRNQDESLRKKRESFWINQLRALYPGGMNLDV